MTAYSPLPYAVFGVSGRTGAATADALLRSGQPVRVVVRDSAKAQAWAERGAEVAVADLTDLAAMTQALSQVQGAYVVSPQHYSREDLFERAELIAEITARAAIAADVPRLVALSSVGADRESGTGWIRMNRMFEQRLTDAGVSTVFLRAAYFMENWMPMVGQAMRSVFSRWWRLWMSVVLQLLCCKKKGRGPAPSLSRGPKTMPRTMSLPLFQPRSRSLSTLQFCRKLSGQKRWRMPISQRPPLLDSPK
ncbi:NmrA family NAD(P)-binding protein [Pseudomonas anguilliseptica]|uniref:NmrA family NAD(P)-binding protein n=1 Tax=Pseudomonas anguilliseptica TaxID=53406 RepID=UPI00325B860F